MFLHQENTFIKEEHTPMNKKLVITTATAFTFLAAPFAGGKADAAGLDQAKVYTNVNAQQFANQEDLE